MSKRIVVLGLGNILLKDEGFGVHLIESLKEQNLPENIELIDGGTAGLDILLTLRDVDKLIIVDAIKDDKPAGTVYRFSAHEIMDNSPLSALSLHHVSVMEALALINHTANAPREIIIYGVEPKEINWGTSLSEEIQFKIPEVRDLVHSELAL